MKKLWLRLAEGLVSALKDEVKYLGGSLRFNSNITARLAMTYRGVGDCDKARLLLWVMGWEAWTGWERPFGVKHLKTLISR